MAMKNLSARGQKEVASSKAKDAWDHLDASNQDRILVQGEGLKPEAADWTVGEMAEEFIELWDETERLDEALKAVEILAIEANKVKPLTAPRDVVHEITRVELPKELIQELKEQAEASNKVANDTKKDIIKYHDVMSGRMNKLQLDIKVGEEAMRKSEIQINKNTGDIERLIGSINSLQESQNRMAEAHRKTLKVVAWSMAAIIALCAMGIIL